MYTIRIVFIGLLVLSLGISLYIKKKIIAHKNHPGWEYAPQMYHSVAYEALSQITNPQAGKWLSNRADLQGEFYNTNTYNPHYMNMRTPAPHTVSRNKMQQLPYRISSKNIQAAQDIQNPLPKNKTILQEGRILYTTFCTHCHGESGKGNGSVGKILKGVPPYNKGRTKNLSAGHIFHVITHGYGRMGAHASQISIEERWKIVQYVQKLQKL